MFTRAMVKLSADELDKVLERVNQNELERTERKYFWAVYSKTIVGQSSIAEWRRWRKRMGIR